MTIKEIRSYLTNYPKYPNVQFCNKAPVVNKAYPGTFNLSLGEPLLLKEYGNYLDYDHDFIYSKIQPCIRSNDWVRIIEKDYKPWDRLALFDLSDISGGIVLTDGSRKKEVLEYTLESFVKFLNSLQIPLTDIYISCFAGGKLREVTQGKYLFNKDVPPFQLGRDLWIKNGIPEKNILEDSSRDTFLPLHLFGIPSHWGFRNEVLIKIRGKILDLGTLEWFLYKPLFNEQGQIYDFTDWEHTLCTSGIGLERLQMVINRLEGIHECDTLKPLYNAVSRVAKYQDVKNIFIVAEGIRTLHRIFSDSGVYDSLSKRQKEKMRDFFYYVFKAAAELRIAINENDLSELLTINAQVQEYYPELRGSIHQIVREIVSAKKRLTKRTESRNQNVIRSNNLQDANLYLSSDE